MSREEKEPASLQEYVKKWKGALQEALNIASRNAHAKEENGKLQYYTVVKKQSEGPVYIAEKENGQEPENFYIVTYFCSVITFLSMQYWSAPLPKDNKGLRKSLWSRKKA